MEPDFFDSAERFTIAARRYLEGSSTASPTAAAAAARAFGDFLREQSMHFLPLPWGTDGRTGFAGAAPAIPDSPAFGLTREHQLRLQRAADAGRRIAAAQRRLQLLWSDALRDAATAFAARLPSFQPAAGNAADARAAAGIEALRKLYAAWIDCAEDAYARIAHSASFGNALADLVNANSALRVETQAAIEQWAKALDLPTRSELNALAQRLKSLQEKLRAQRTPGTRATAVKPAAAKPPAAKPARRAPRVRRTKRSKS